MATKFQRRNLPGLLREAREVLRTQMSAHLRQYGLTDQQWRVLRIINAHTDPMCEEIEAGRIAREAQILPPSLTGILARMERDGLLTRSKGVDDARFSVVRPTEKGLALVDAMAGPFEAHYAWLEKRIGKDRMVQLYELLDLLIATGDEHNVLAESAAVKPAPRKKK